MAFFRNYLNETVTEGAVDEKDREPSIERVQNMVGNEDVDVTSSDKDFEMKIDGQFQSSDVEPDDVSRLQDEAAADEGGSSNLQPSTRRNASAGKWGSSFWKDCQPMRGREGSESGQESKSSSGYKNEEGLDDDSSDGKDDRSECEDDDDEQKEADKDQRGQIDVPADEMLSDDYYEQDGDDQSDSLHHRVLNNTNGFKSKTQSRPVAAKNHVSRNSKTSNGDEYEDDDDADFEDEDDEEDGKLFLIYQNFPPIFEYYVKFDFLLATC